jgi:hypothetical protein
MRRGHGLLRVYSGRAREHQPAQLICSTASTAPYSTSRSSQAPDPNDPMAAYDFTWLWRELKVEHLRS